MTQVTTTGAELSIVRGGITTSYAYSAFRSLSWFRANNGNYVVTIIFNSDAGGNVPLKISLNEVDNQVTWTNDTAGAEAAVYDISKWVAGLYDYLDQIATNTYNIAGNTTRVVRTPHIVRSSGSSSIAGAVVDFSVSNVGSANGTILGTTIKPGETLNFSAGALNNYYAPGTITYDGTGTELLIIYNS